MRAIPLLLAVSFLSGCFVFDELDQAEQILDETTRGKRLKREAREAARAPETTETTEQKRAPKKPSGESGAVAKLQEWWDEATAPAPIPPDPNDSLVRCKLSGGGERFSRRYDCLNQGGRVENLPPPAVPAGGADARSS